MEQAKIDRINELARKAKTPEGLTLDEMEERALLRREYVQAVLGNLESQLEHTVVVDEEGHRRKLKKREE
jgi:uncharacterized protein YnzC (UPF0291/DUF896 family)